jgi:hypothetical protein
MRIPEGMIATNVATTSVTAYLFLVMADVLSRAYCLPSKQIACQHVQCRMACAWPFFTSSSS